MLRCLSARLASRMCPTRHGYITSRRRQRMRVSRTLRRWRAARGCGARNWQTPSGGPMWSNRSVKWWASGASGGCAEALDAELLRKRLGACRDRVTQLVRLEQHRVAAQGEHLALDPLVAADRQVADGAPVGQRPRAALDRPACDLRVV